MSGVGGQGKLPPFLKSHALKVSAPKPAALGRHIITIISGLAMLPLRASLARGSTQLLQIWYSLLSPWPSKSWSTQITRFRAEVPLAMKFPSAICGNLIQEFLLDWDHGPGVWMRAVKYHVARNKSVGTHASREKVQPSHQVLKGAPNAVRQQTVPFTKK